MKGCFLRTTTEYLELVPDHPMENDHVEKAFFQTFGSETEPKSLNLFSTSMIGTSKINTFRTE